jgi:quercetin dioxygenase-like cupin family protein
VSPARRRRFALEVEAHLAVRCVMCGLRHRTVLPFHSQEYGQLLYATAGAMSVHASDSLCILPAGKAVMIPAGSRHSVRMRGRVEMRSLVFPGDPGGVFERENPRVISVTGLLRELILRAVQLGAFDIRSAEERRLLDVLVDEIGRSQRLPLVLPVPLPNGRGRSRSACWRIRVGKRAWTTS